MDNKVSETGSCSSGKSNVEELKKKNDGSCDNKEKKGETENRQEKGSEKEHKQGGCSHK